MRGDALKGHLDYLILSILADNPLHGYAIIDQLRTRSDEVIDVPEGTLYPALHRLEKAGLITASWSEVNRRRRKSYRLTPSGTRQLADERQAWASFSAAVAAITGDRR
ncbi:MAG: PadR family transcriptional regulator [Micropruina sp.]|uniref:PadR family transcriptional regulator n=1 Tax=Micropruina sp. TaxID=2737536 RepID=UPI0039E67E95